MELVSEAHGVEQRLDAVSQTMPLSSLWTVTIEKDGSTIRHCSLGFTDGSCTASRRLEERETRVDVRTNKDYLNGSHVG